MVPADNVIGQFGQRLAVDFHDQPVRFEMRIHPVEREAFLNVKFVVGIFIENDFGDQAVDVHDGNLAADLSFAIAHFEALSWLEFVLLAAALGIRRVVRKHCWESVSVGM